jgi:hypothetical protein
MSFIYIFQYFGYKNARYASGKIPEIIVSIVVHQFDDIENKPIKQGERIMYANSLLGFHPGKLGFYNPFLSRKI